MQFYPKENNRRAENNVDIKRRVQDARETPLRNSNKNDSDYELHHRINHTQQGYVI